MLHVLLPPQGGVLPAHAFRGASQSVFQPSSVKQPVQKQPPVSQQTRVCVCVVYIHGVGVLVSVCECSLIPSPYFHSEVGIEMRTVSKTSVGVSKGVSTCGCVFICM